MFAMLAQGVAGSGGGPSASAIFYLTLLFIFLTAIVTTVFTKWARDKCLKFFRNYHVTLERTRGQTTWGNLRVFSSGLEVLFDHAHTDAMGMKKTSFLIYGQEMDAQVLALFRYHDELDDKQRAARDRQIHHTFNPGPFRRAWRGVRNFVNTLRDAFNAAIGAVVGQYQKVNPASAVITSQGTSFTAISQTLLGRFANAYEPLLEQYIGQPVILEVADPLNPNNASVQYAGYLADYTQGYVAVFNVKHTADREVELELPDVDSGPALPPLPMPPPPGAPMFEMPTPLKMEHDLAVRIDGKRLKIQNAGREVMVVRRLERGGFEPLKFGMVLPPNAVLDLPARDARSGKLFVEVVRCLDVVAPRKYAIVRHAGELVDRPGLLNELHLDRLPLVPRILAGNGRKESK